MPLITTTSQLKKLCTELTSSPYIAIDTEFLRDQYYYPKLCLIQVAAPGKGAHIIDPLAETMDISVLFPLLLQETTVKVFHAARQDIEILFNIMGVMPKPVFDTQIAAMVCGFGLSSSYATLAQELTQITIDKSVQFSEWSRRPLSPEQKKYALQDVVVLLDIYTILLKKLKKSGRTAWIKEELEKMVNPAYYTVNPEELWKKIRNKVTSPRAAMVLKELVQWREHTVQQNDIPRNFMLRDEALVDIANHMPSTTRRLLSFRGTKYLQEHPPLQKEALSLIKKAASLPLPPQKELPPLPPPIISIDLLLFFDMLKILLKIKSREHKVADRLIASSDELLKLATENKPNIPALHGWRYDIFGKAALRLKKGKLKLGMKRGKAAAYEGIL